MRDLVGGSTRQVNVSSDEQGAADDLRRSNSGGVAGRYVTFTSSAPDLVAGHINGYEDVSVRDIVDGTTVRANTSGDGAQADAETGNGSITSDRRYLIFDSPASNLVDGDID